MSGHTIPWDDLTQTGQDAVADVIELLAEGFTGEITLHCKEGGVGGFHISGGKGLVQQLKEARRLKMALTTGATKT